MLQQYISILVLLGLTAWSSAQDCSTSKLNGNGSIKTKPNTAYERTMECSSKADGPLIYLPSTLQTNCALPYILQGGTNDALIQRMSADLCGVKIEVASANNHDRGKATHYTIAGVVTGADIFTVKDDSVLPVDWKAGAVSIDWWSEIAGSK